MNKNNNINFKYYKKIVFYFILYKHFEFNYNSIIVITFVSYYKIVYILGHKY